MPLTAEKVNSDLLRCTVACVEAVPGMNVTCCTTSFPSAPLKTFLDKYNARFTQQEATSFSTYGYDSVMALMAALKKAGEPDRDKVAAAFADFDVTTSLGTRITFKNPPDGNNVNPSVVAIQITGRGSYVAV